MKNQFNGKPPKWKPCFECSSIARRAILGLDVEGMQAMEPCTGHRQKAASPEGAMEACLGSRMGQMDAAIFGGNHRPGWEKMKVKDENFSSCSQAGSKGYEDAMARPAM